jgi:sugar lactone lactonase YvrE
VGCGDIHSKQGPNGIVAIEPDGSARLVARNIPRPNGMALTPDLDRLIFACPDDGKLCSLAVGPDGTLSDLRIFAELPDQPDGVCLDAEGAVWVGTPTGRAFHRVREGGEITHTIAYDDRRAVIPMLGGPGRRTLFLGGASWEDDLFAAVGFIETVEVEVPGAGLP